jgi:methyl-accepting chemotaxis protein
MKNVPITGKFLLILSVFGVFTLAVAAYVGGQMWSIDQRFSGLSAGKAHAAFEVTRASRLLVKAQLSIADLIVAAQASDVRRALQDFAHARTVYPQQLDQAASDDPADADAYLAFKDRGLALMDKTCAPAIAAGKSSVLGDARGASAAYHGACAQSFAKLVDDMTVKSLAVAKDVDGEADALTLVTKGAIATTFVLIVLGLAAVTVGTNVAVRAWIPAP